MDIKFPARPLDWKIGGLMYPRRIRGATPDIHDGVTVPVHDRVTIPVRQHRLVSTSPPAPEPLLDDGTVDVAEHRALRASGIVRRADRREAEYAVVMRRLVARRGEGLPQVGEEDRTRLQEIAERADSGRGVTAAELLWLGELLTRSIDVTTLESVALVEIIEALAHHSFDEPDRAHERLTRCAVLLLSVRPEAEAI
jgi:hypothetical protein